MVSYFLNSKLYWILHSIDSLATYPSVELSKNNYWAFQVTQCFSDVKNFMKVSFFGQWQNCRRTIRDEEMSLITAISKTVIVNVNLKVDLSRIFLKKESGKLQRLHIQPAQCLEYCASCHHHSSWILLFFGKFITTLARWKRKLLNFLSKRIIFSHALSFFIVNLPISFPIETRLQLPIAY